MTLSPRSGADGDRGCVPSAAIGLPAWSGAFCVLLIGVLACCFAGMHGYARLLNVKFRWFTMSGGVLLVVMGGASLRGGQRPRIGDIAAVAALLTVVALGRPQASGIATASMAPPDIPVVLSLDDPNFPHVDIRDLRDALGKETMGDGGKVTVVGMAQRLRDPAYPDQAVVLRSYIVCCAADAVGMGFRVLDERMQQFANGQWVIVRGSVSKLPDTQPVEPFRCGASAFVSVNSDYALTASTIDAYDAVAYLPLMPDRMSSDSVTGFKQILLDAGLLDTLRTRGPYTLFVPVNAALADLDTSAADGSTMRDCLTRHIIEGRYLEHELFGVTELSTIDGHRIAVTAGDGRLRVGNARIVFADQLCRNGIIHLVYPAVATPGESAPPARTD